jgi:hypothetical protein
LEVFLLFEVDVCRFVVSFAAVAANDEGWGGGCANGEGLMNTSSTSGSRRKNVNQKLVKPTHQRMIKMVVVGYWLQ